MTPDSTIRDTATTVLKARGLNQELISLGGLLVSPKPAQRCSVISLIKNRTDIDPVVWLLQLSHDTGRDGQDHGRAGPGRPDLTDCRGQAPACRDGSLRQLGAGPPDGEQVRSFRSRKPRPCFPRCPDRRASTPRPTEPLSPLPKVRGVPPCEGGLGGWSRHHQSQGFSRSLPLSPLASLLQCEKNQRAHKELTEWGIRNAECRRKTN